MRDVSEWTRASSTIIARNALALASALVTTVRRTVAVATTTTLWATRALNATAVSAPKVVVEVVAVEAVVVGAFGSSNRDDSVAGSLTRVLFTIILP